MLLSLTSAAVLALQIAVTAVDTSGRERTLCVGVGCPSRPDSVRRIAVTAEHLRTAYRDTAARTLLLRAREARMRQDSAIVSYEADTYQRVSVGMKAAAIGRDRVIFRTESATRVRWHRDRGAFVEVKGARNAIVGQSRDEANREMIDDVGDMSVLPYTPGAEVLWIGGSRIKAEVDEQEIIHPLAVGSEAYYTYASGDRAGFRLPDGREIRLRELKVRPRTSRWNVVVGSLWFDLDRGQLVRAAYRLAEPLDVYAKALEDDADAFDDVPLPIRGMLKTMSGQITGLAVEYGLYQGRFWLPRLQSVEGQGEAAFLRVPFSMAQSFRYSAVNATALDTLPTLPRPRWVVEQAMLDSMPAEEATRWRDSTNAARREARKARADSIEQGLVKSYKACDTGRFHTAMESSSGTPIAVRIPCDIESLARSPELPGSLFGENEELFDASARDALLAQAISLGAQPDFDLRPPQLHYGLSWLRYNRVEGLSIGAGATQALGAGYTADAALRMGLADLEPNAELGLARTDLTHTVRLGAYNRLVSASDWGNPLSFGSSLSALLWGRDDGFYYRASGAELTGRREHGATFTWRLFGALERPAAVETDFSLAKALRNSAFQPNIAAVRGVWGGASVRAVRSMGLDPRGWRALGDARLEAAAGAPDSGGTANYARVATDVTFSRALGPSNSRAPLAALTLSGGTTVGPVPVQRFWYLGGTHTVRGQAPGTMAGDAYWFGRLELAQELSVARVSLFGDAGWAGSRESFSSTRAMSGTGVGVGLLDGLIRLDVARGIHPSRGWRTDLYLEARF